MNRTLFHQNRNQTNKPFQKPPTIFPNSSSTTLYIILASPHSPHSQTKLPLILPTPNSLSAYISPSASCFQFFFGGGVSCLLPHSYSPRPCLSINSLQHISSSIHPPARRLPSLAPSFFLNSLSFPSLVFFVPLLCSPTKTQFDRG